MADTQQRRTLVNHARRKLSAKQIKAGFGGKRRQAAAKTRHKPRSKPRAQQNAPKRRHSKPASQPVKHRRRTSAHRRRSTPNTGKIVSFSLPKEFQTVATTKKNLARKNKSGYRWRAASRKNTHHRRRTHRNPSMGDITGLVTTAVFTVAGAVGTQQLTQVVLQANNTGVMGYFGNLVAAFLLSWGVKAFMKNDRAAAAVLSGGFVEIVLRLIADYTPFGQFTSNLGMGDYLAQWYNTPQQLKAGVQNWTHSAALATSPTFNLQAAGMSGCNGGGLYGGSLY
jgi:hypothetical protein